MQHPLKTLVTMAALFGVLALMAFVYPKEGIKIGDGVVLKFPELAQCISKKEEKKDISKILALADKINARDSIIAADSLLADSPLVDSLQIKDTSAIKLINTIQFRNKAALDAF